MSITPSPTPSPKGGTEGGDPSGHVSTSSARSAWSLATGGGESGPGSSAPLWTVIALAIVSVVGMAGAFYYAHDLSSRVDQVNADLQASLTTQKEMLEQLGGRLDEGDARDAELQTQVGQTQQRLGITQNEIQRTRQQTAAELERQRQAAEQAAQQVAQQSAQQAQQLASRLGELQQDQAATKGNLGSLTTDVAGVRGDVKTTKDELSATRSELQRVIGDLGVQSGLVAHNRSELEELKARGEREYIEFDLLRRSRVQRFGTIQLELKRTDPRRQKYTVNLIVDDRTIEKKDKNVFEPVQFYQAGFRAPTEIVVNRIDRDRIVGYISTPKKKEDRAPMRSAS